MSTQVSQVLISNLTRDRLSSYLKVTDGDLFSALELCRWNTEISAAFFQVLADLEVFLRNAIDRELQTMCITLGYRGSWFDEPRVMLPPKQKVVIGLTRAYLVEEGKPLTHSNMVSHLNFGFWRSLLVRWNKDNLWPNALRFAFPHSPSRQPEYIFTRVRHLHILRNRIAHHEPIHNRDIVQDYQICIDVLRAISPVIADWSAGNSHVLQVLAHRPL